MHHFGMSCGMGPREHGGSCGSGHAGPCSCGCCSGHGGFARRFISKAEKLEKLEEYKDQLKKELAGVEERIQELECK